MTSLKPKELIWIGCDNCKILNGAPYPSSEINFVKELEKVWNEKKEPCFHCNQNSWVIVKAKAEEDYDVDNLGIQSYKRHLHSQGWKRV